MINNQVRSGPRHVLPSVTIHPNETELPVGASGFGVWRGRAVCRKSARWTGSEGMPDTPVNGNYVTRRCSEKLVAFGKISRTGQIVLIPHEFGQNQL